MEQTELNRSATRRDFLRRLVKVCIATAAAAALGYRFHDPRGPDPDREQPIGARLPDFSIPEITARLAVARGSDRKETVTKALAALGGAGAFIEKGDRVLLKVNAAFASPPLLSATTHPDLVTALTRLCFEAGAVSVTVTDNPINDPASCFALTGIAEAARRSGAKVVLPERPLFKPLSVPGARLIRDWPVLFDPFKQVDKVIGLAPVKDHHRSGASMSLKNWYGLLGGRRNMFHQDIHTIIQELGMMITPTLVVLDGTFTMMANGPTGGSLSDLKQTETMIVSTDQVAADAFGATLLDKPREKLVFISKAEAAGLGTADYRSLNPEIIGSG